MSAPGHDGDDGWVLHAGRLCRPCTCSDWVEDGKPNPIEPGALHSRERVSGAPIEICYYADAAARTVTILGIRTMAEGTP